MSFDGRSGGVLNFVAGEVDRAQPGSFTMYSHELTLLFIIYDAVSARLMQREVSHCLMSVGTLY